MGIDSSDIINLNNFLVKIISKYQEVIREMNALSETIYLTIDQPNNDELIKATILKVMHDVGEKLREVDLMINIVRQEFESEVKPIIH